MVENVSPENVLKQLDYMIEQFKLNGGFVLIGFVDKDGFCKSATIRSPKFDSAKMLGLIEIEKNANLQMLGGARFSQKWNVEK